jgi:hypothetical protein
MDAAKNISKFGADTPAECKCTLLLKNNPPYPPVLDVHAIRVASLPNKVFHPYNGAFSALG